MMRRQIAAWILVVGAFLAFITLAGIAVGRV